MHLVGDIEARGDNTTLVETTVELDNNLLGTVVVDDLELANVACGQERNVSASSGTARLLPPAKWDSGRLPNFACKSSAVLVGNLLTELLHDLEELHNHLAGRAEENLARDGYRFSGLPWRFPHKSLERGSGCDEPDAFHAARRW